jgi:hypothetical protein
VFPLKDLRVADIEPRRVMVDTLNTEFMIFPVGPIY